MNKLLNDLFFRILVLEQVLSGSKNPYILPDIRSLMNPLPLKLGIKALATLGSTDEKLTLLSSPAFQKSVLFGSLQISPSRRYYYFMNLLRSFIVCTKFNSTHWSVI